tara:strand:- start:36 stop:524 length:489 start_codon:yes stop_codon:yes gene_type:complete
MNLSNFYPQVRADHAKAIKGLRFDSQLPNYRDYKSIKAISGCTETVFIYSSLGNARVTTKYYIKDEHKKAETKFYLFNNLIATLESKINAGYIYKFDVHILGSNWLSRTTFKHLNKIFDAYEVTTSGKQGIGQTLRAYTKKFISYVGDQEVENYGAFNVMYE